MNILESKFCTPDVLKLSVNFVYIFSVTIQMSKLLLNILVLNICYRVGLCRQSLNSLSWQFVLKTG